MIKLETHLGIITVGENYFANLVGNVVSSCYGVSGMVKSGAMQNIRSFFSNFSKRTFADEGVRVRAEEDKLIVDIHISVIYGMNISAIAKSIVNKVRYTVEEATGLDVKKVNVYVDEMKND